MFVNEDRVCLSICYIFVTTYRYNQQPILLMALISSILRSEEILSQKDFPPYEKGANCFFCRCIKSFGENLLEPTQ